MRIFDLVQFYLLLLLTYLRDMKAYCLTTGHCIVCHCCCILSCYALCFLILLALKSSVFFWLLPLHFCRFKIKIIVLFCLCFFSALCRFVSTFFSLFVRIFFAFFFRLFFAFFLLFFSLFFRIFPRENAIFDFQQKPEKLPKNEVQKKRKKSGQKANEKRNKSEKKSGNKNADIHPISTAFSSEGSCLPSCGFVFCILRFLCCMSLLGFCFDVPSLTYILPCHISKINKPIHPDFGKHARCDSYAYRSTHLRYIQASDILKRSNRR